MALLAQTCSAIGNDSTPNPKLLANIEKSTKRDKISPLSSTNGGSPNDFKSSFKPYESSLKDNDAPDDLRVASRLKASSGGGKITNGNERCESTQSSSSQQMRKSPPSTSSPKTSHHHNNNNNNSSSDHKSNSSASVKSTTPTSQQDAKSDKDAAAVAALRSLPTTGPYPMPYLNGYNPYGAYNPMELLAQQSMLKAAALNPYLQYAARMKAAGAEMLAAGGVCRDPYCTGCSLSSHLMGKNGATPQCPPGCTCDHSMSKAMAANPAAAMAYHAQLAQLAAASQMPYV